MTRTALRKMPLDFLLIYATSGALLVVATVFFLVAEWSNPATIGSVAPLHRIPLAFLQATAPRSIGFSAFDLSEMNEHSLFFTIGLMFIGGAAGSTAGGIKVATFALLFFALMATLRSDERINVFRRELPESVMRQALAIALLGVAAVFAVTVLLASLAEDEFLPVFFEAVSAVGTVGLSMGITADHNVPARFLIMLSMLAGRFGPILLVLAMNKQRPRKTLYTLPEQSVRLG